MLPWMATSAPDDWLSARLEPVTPRFRNLWERGTDGDRRRLGFSGYEEGRWDGRSGVEIGFVDALGGAHGEETEVELIVEDGDVVFEDDVGVEFG